MLDKLPLIQNANGVNNFFTFFSSPFNCIILVYTANCISIGAENNRKLVKEYSMEYTLLLYAVRAKRKEASQVPSDTSMSTPLFEQTYVEKKYLLRILDKLTIEIETFLYHCQYVAKINCRHCYVKL